MRNTQTQLKGKPEKSLPVAKPCASPRRLASLEEEPTGDLVRKAAKDDERAWAELFNRFGSMVLRVAQRTGLSAADAADVQQATWIQLRRRVDQIRDPDRLGAWLATTARRQSQRVAMAASRVTPSPDPVGDYGSLESNGDQVEAAVLRGHYEAMLEQALSRLPAVQRHIILSLTSDDNPSYEEVGKAIGMPVGSIGPMRMRALQTLRRDPHLQAEYAALRPPAASNQGASVSTSSITGRPR
jgi:RNA polymerase sigma factor (sigma-70 family)